MTRRALALTAAGAALAAALLTPTAQAAPPAPAKPGKGPAWSTLVGSGVTTITEPGLHRTPDGTLHVAVATRDAANQNSISVSHVTAAGTYAGTSPAVGPWASTTLDPDLVSGVGGSGLRLVFGGLRTTTTGDAYSEGYLYSASADDAGAAWALAPNTAPVVGSTSGYGSYGTGVTTMPDGSLAAAYPLNSTITYQVGAGPVQSFTVPACCAYDMSLVQQDGVVWASWYANGSAASDQGVFVRQLYPTLGPTLQAPGSVSGGSSLAADQAVAMVARPGGGVYVAYKVGYPTAKSLAVWKVGDPSARTVPDSKGASYVALSTTPDGRLWVAFDGARKEARAVRTDPSATTFGAVQELKVPGEQVYGIAVDGGTGRGDVVVNTGTAVIHTQVLAGLTVQAKPGALKAGRAGLLKVTVTDAGDTVKGSKVKARGAKCTTNGKGVCVLRLGKARKGKVVVLATASGYDAGSDLVKVR
ncbi:hypothetical protein [Nocardioides flavescens]|uniref:Ig-like domain (Group 3) n=1 Tax=Nocardioides flavescens TaxID=2691959 RepID=A0A6L7EXB3_9ACTN|nr:hypothetical protein [Nocardioides flavescens]MXG88925.1 hypothetical protein [Nocardioides flavescens]